MARLSHDVVADIRKARASGMSLLEIAIEYNIDVATASKRCRGIPQPAGIRPGRRRKFDHANAARLNAMGVSASTLAERFGVTEPCLRRAIKAQRMAAASFSMLNPSYALEAAE